MFQAATGNARSPRVDGVAEFRVFSSLTTRCPCFRDGWNLAVDIRPMQPHEPGASPRGWTVVDTSTPLLSEDVPGIDADPMSFLDGEVLVGQERG